MKHMLNREYFSFQAVGRHLDLSKSLLLHQFIVDVKPVLFV